jgi:hypothetical protein
VAQGGTFCHEDGDGIAIGDADDLACEGSSLDRQRDEKGESGERTAVYHISAGARWWAGGGVTILQAHHGLAHTLRRRDNGCRDGGVVAPFYSLIESAKTQWVELRVDCGARGSSE